MRLLVVEDEPKAAAALRKGLVEKGYDPTYGARPMRRSVERYLEDPLAEELLKGNLHEGDPVEVTAEGGKLTFNQKATPAAGTEATLSS